MKDETVIGGEAAPVMSYSGSMVTVAGLAIKRTQGLPGFSFVLETADAGRR